MGTTDDDELDDEVERELLDITKTDDGVQITPDDEVDERWEQTDDEVDEREYLYLDTQLLADMI